ncbi:TonB-dependent receptor plug domain-containing protein [Yunchengibacter salinarum]|uniref:TonB-dependent receptor plug domain-containing protein n=1 Tax=Yunchengibacter salinarum TaxID=3133399 RepID=UPI0035B57B9B
MSDELKTYRRSALMGSAATLLASFALGVGAPASAQDAGGAEETFEELEALEEIAITGSRIVRRDLTAPSPISTIDAAEFELSGAVNVENVLARLPQTIPGFGSASNNPGNGTATVNLRGLGTTRTLVLVNGRRWVAADTSGIVDLNTIPPALIQRTEIVTGGASAIYGSDAVAGVVNFVLKDNFEGAEFSGQYDTTTRGDAERYTLNGTVGGNFDGGRGNVTAYFNYTKRKPLFQGDRDFSTYALADGDPNDTSEQDPDFGDGAGLVRGGSSGIPGTRVFAGPGVDQDGDGVADFTLGRFLSDGTGAPFTSDDFFNYAPDNFLQLPQERWEIHTSANYQLTDDIRFYSEGTFTNTRVPQELAPTPAFVGTLEVNPDSPFFGSGVQGALDGIREDTNGDGVIDGDDNAFLPFIGRRMVEVGSRQSLDSRNSWRVVTGLDGELGEGWTFDLYYQFARMEQTNALNNDVAESRFRQAIMVTDDGQSCQDPSGGCVPLNIFGPGNITEEAANFINVGAANIVNWQQQVVQGSVSGTLGDWFGAGDVGLAIGSEYRSQSASFRPDEFLAGGDVLGFNAGQPTQGRFDVYEIFGEVAVPLISEQPGFHSLELTGAARFSDYSTAGTVWSFSSGLTWAPVEDLSFRGQFQRAVRAPNVEELFGGQSQGFPPAQDPCSDATSNPDQALIDICEASGVPAGLVGNFQQANSQIEGVFGGNPDLFEEESDTWTVGAVFTPSAMPNFSASIDYYNIQIDDAVGTLGGGVPNVLDLCFNQIQDLNSPFCQAVNRRVDGNVDTVEVLNANIASLETEGIDLQWDYALDMDGGLFDNGGSTLDFAFVGTYVINNDFLGAVFPGNPELESPVTCEGNFGNTCGRPDPEFRFNLRTTYTEGPFQVSVNWEWLDSVSDDRIDNTDGIMAADLPVPSVGSESYFDLTARYDINEMFQLSGGVQNLFDNKPDFLGDAQQQANTFPETYDLFGTRVFVGGRVRF